MITYSDPIHGEVSVPDRYSSILNSGTLGRLRNVKQLGYTVSKYPGAVHTRFEHTLGTVGVVSDVLEAFGEAPNGQASLRPILAALVSEIGSTPLSYTARPIFKTVGLDKIGMRRILLDYEMAGFPGIQTLVKALDCNERISHAKWDSICAELPAFDYLDLVKVASMIDYVRRDAHYCGRFQDSFDYRGFLDAVRDYAKGKRAYDLHELLQSLHRAAYALNLVYGDPDRRALTTILRRLAFGLINDGFLDLAPYTQPARLIELDDDVFLATLAHAVEQAGEGSRWSPLFEHVTELGEFHTTELAEHGGDLEGRPVEEIERIMAAELDVPVEQVVVFGGTLDDHNGFRMFGTEFGTAAEALGSTRFLSLTGLQVDSIQPSVPGPARVSTFA